MSRSSAEKNHKTFLAYVPGEQFSFEWVAVVIIHLWYRPFFSANIFVINASCQCWCSLHLFGSVLVDHTLDWLFFSGLHSLCFLFRFSRYIADWIQSFEPIHTSSVHCYKWVGCLYEYFAAHRPMSLLWRLFSASSYWDSKDSSWCHWKFKSLWLLPLAKLNPPRCMV